METKDKIKIVNEHEKSLVDKARSLKKKPIIKLLMVIFWTNIVCNVINWIVIYKDGSADYFAGNITSLQALVITVTTVINSVFAIIVAGWGIYFIISSIIKRCKNNKIR